LVVDVVCGGCCEALERRFVRPLSTAGHPTLGDLVIETFERKLEYLQECRDPDLAEVLPGLVAVAKPARGRLMWADARLAAALKRVSEPACATIPAWAEEAKGEEWTDGPFLLAEWVAPGGTGVDQACRGAVASKGCPNAHDFAQDGAYLPGRGCSRRGRGRQRPRTSHQVV